jgi:pimeloyl-ACP methyl ester carboxylesterase
MRKIEDKVFMKRYFCLLFLFFALPIIAQESQWELSESLSVGGATQFTLAYPAAWQATSQRGNVLITELEQDQAFAEGYVVEGYVIRFERIAVRGLRELGINPQEADLADAVEALAEAEGYAAEREITEMTLLTWPALRLRTVDAVGNHLDSIIAFQELELMRLSLIAPSAEALEAFDWEAVLASIQIQGGQVNLGDYTLSFECEGEGSPTVIMEAGWGGDYQYMRPAIQGVSRFTRVCAVTRRFQLGIGAIEQHTEDLHEVLSIAGIEPPYVFAGHSYGGLVIRVFNDEYPSEIVGMVFIDSAQESQLERMEELFSPETFASIDYSPDDSVPFPDFQTSLARAAETASLGDMPVIVLTAEYCCDSSDPLYEEMQAVFQPIWISEIQVNLVNLSTEGRQIIVPNTNHISIVSNPATVDAIREIVEGLRTE